MKNKELGKKQRKTPITELKKTGRRSNNNKNGTSINRNKLKESKQMKENGISINRNNLKESKQIRKCNTQTEMN